MTAPTLKRALRSKLSHLQHTYLYIISRETAWLSGLPVNTKYCGAYNPCKIRSSQQQNSKFNNKVEDQVVFCLPTKACAISTLVHC